MSSIIKEYYEKAHTMPVLIEQKMLKFKIIQILWLNLNTGLRKRNIKQAIRAIEEVLSMESKTHPNPDGLW